MVVGVSVRGVGIESLPQVGACVIQMYSCILISILKVLPEYVWTKLTNYQIDYCRLIHSIDTMDGK